MNTPVLINLKKLTFISSVPTLDVIKRTYPKSWPIGTDRESGLKESVLSVYFDDTDNDIYKANLYF